MSNDRVYDVHCGLVDTYRFGVDTMHEHHIKATQLHASSIKSAMKKATNFAKEQDEIVKRFAYESPRWSDRYDIPYHDMLGIRVGMTRLFQRDIDNTGKVAYIHLIWYLREEERWDTPVTTGCA